MCSQIILLNRVSSEAALTTPLTKCRALLRDVPVLSPNEVREA